MPDQMCIYVHKSLIVLLGKIFRVLLGQINLMYALIVNNFECKEDRLPRKRKVSEIEMACKKASLVQKKAIIIMM